MALAPLALYRAELNERLVVHWTGGAWRVPLGLRHLPVTGDQGVWLGRIVCAEGGDLARARAGLVPAPAPGIDALDAALAPVAGLLAAVRALEGHPGDHWDPEAARQAMARGAAGPAALLSAAATPLSGIVGRLAAGAAAGVVWKPAPAAAASAHLAMRALVPLLGRSAALLQGDHGSGAVLVGGLGAVDWAAPGPVPEGLTSAARVPCHH